MSKECKKCLVKRPLIEFYKNSKMKDGFVNICKACYREKSKMIYLEKSKNDDFLEKERLRGRLKYAKYKYKNIRSYQSVELSNLHRDLKIPKGKQGHHWSYNKNDLKDVFILDRRTHSRIHTKMVLDPDLLYFRNEKGELLNTRKKHYDYIKTVITDFNLQFNLDLKIPEYED